MNSFPKTTVFAEGASADSVRHESHLQRPRRLREEDSKGRGE